jgi:hypothetical protein
MRRPLASSVVVAAALFNDAAPRARVRDARRPALFELFTARLRVSAMSLGGLA